MVIYLISKEGYLSISSILTVPHPTVPSLSPVCTGKSTFSLAGRRQTSSAKVNLRLLIPDKVNWDNVYFFHQIKLLTISLGICQIKRHFSLIAILLYRAGQLTKHLSRVRQLAASLEGYSISPQVIFDPSYPLRIQLFSAFLHHPHHFNPPPRPICLPNHHWV